MLRVNESPTTSLVNRDSGTRRASRLAVQFDVGELFFHNVAFIAENLACWEQARSNRGKRSHQVNLGDGASPRSILLKAEPERQRFAGAKAVNMSGNESSQHVSAFIFDISVVTVGMWSSLFD